MSSARSTTWPPSGCRSPLIVLRTVDFPEPLGPIKHVILPVSTVKSTPFRINPAPYPAVTPESVRMIDSPRLRVSGRSVELSIIGGVPSTSAAEIRVQDQRVGLHLGGRTHGDRCPTIEN